MKDFHRIAEVYLTDCSIFSIKSPPYALVFGGLITYGPISTIFGAEMAYLNLKLCYMGSERGCSPISSIFALQYMDVI